MYTNLPDDFLDMHHQRAKALHRRAELDRLARSTRASAPHRRRRAFAISPVARALFGSRAAKPDAGLRIDTLIRTTSSSLK